MRKILLISLALCLTACANIPIATMLKFSSFDEDSFRALNSAVIKAKVDLSAPHTLNLEQTRLALIMETPSGFRNFDFPLVLEEQATLKEEAGFFSAAKDYTQYTFRVSEEGIQNFATIQQELGPNSEGEHSFSVGTGFNEAPTEGDAIVFSIHLQLTATDDFITVIDHAEVEFKNGD